MKMKTVQIITAILCATLLIGCTGIAEPKAEAERTDVMERDNSAETDSMKTDVTEKETAETKNDATESEAEGADATASTAEESASVPQNTTGQKDSSAVQGSAMSASGEAFMKLNEIKVTDIQPLRIGQVENADAATGMTVLISENGMRAGLDVRGGGPASRDSQMLNPLMSMQQIHSIVLSGGSAFGLGAANGVMDYLEEHDIGFDTGVAKVPLVVQSDIYDLTVGAADVRPDSQMGYEAAKAAFENPNYKDGNYGAGCGASVGKITGMERAMKTGVGSYAVQVGDLQIGAIVVVNALGDIYDWKTGNQIAGLLSEDKTKLASTMESMSASIEAVDNKFTGNTTIAVIITNANFNKSQLCKIAGMGHDGYARSINPVHTSADGDSIYAVSVGDVSADQDLVGSLGAEVLSEAIIRAVTSADSAYGLPSAAELGFAAK